MRIRKTGVQVVEVIAVFDAANAGVTTLNDGDFTKALYLDGTASGVTVTATRIGSTNKYTVTFTPNSIGQWWLLVTQSTHNPRGWAETYDVTTDGVLSGAQTADALLDRAGAIDGYTPREAGTLSLAALAGRDVGTLANPQYEAVDGSVVRLDATIVAGIRTAVTRDAT